MDLRSERFTSLLTLLSLAFPLVFIVTLKSPNYASTAPQPRCAKSQNATIKAMAGTGSNATTLTTKDSRNESFPPYNSIPSDEKLLNGLLAPGFDEQSCLSRYQSYLYRKDTPHKPSPYLISKLRDYENLHQKCGLHTKPYNTTMSKLINSGNNVTDTTLCKYLVWTASNGLGNRMVSMVASFLYAVLTNRVFLVEFEADMIGLFCEPFPYSSWILSQDFSHVIHHSHIQTYESMLKSDHNGIIKLPPSSFIIDLNLQHGYNDHKRFFHCDHNQHLLHKIPVLILSSDQYFVPSLFMVSSFNQELSQMFPEKDSVFFHLGHYLFHPSNNAWGLIKNFYNSHLGKADEKIGLQIRLFDPNRTSPQSVMAEVLACALENKLLPKLETQDSIIPDQSKNKTLKVILVASLHSEYSEMLKAMYVAKPTVTGEIVDVFQPSHEEHQEFHNNMHNVKALVEIYLLSLCDALVTSSKSTFGYVAQGLGGLKPLILKKAKLGGVVRNPPCKKSVSMEPCFHYPPWHSCFLPNTVLNVTFAFPHIKHCEDFGWGIKMVK